MKTETVLITGASSGIGLELARCFAADGSRLVLVARNQQALDKLAAELRNDYSATVDVLTADLSLPETPIEIWDRLRAAGISIDVLVNNAGFGAQGRFVELSAEQQLAILQVNVMALTHLTRLFLPGMVERRRGGVLNVASTAGFQPGPGMAVYYASKACVISLSEAIAEEVSGTGVGITALCPGPTKTNFAQAAGTDATRLFRRNAMSAKAVAEIGYEAFRKGRVLTISGLQNKLGAFVVRFAPRSVARKAAGYMNSTVAKSR